MKISYDAEVDALSITFRETTVTTKHLAEGIVADYDSEGRLAGLEILDAKTRLAMRIRCATSNSKASANSPMKITRQATANKLSDYLRGKVSQAELVEWAERAMMDADFDEADAELLADIIGRLGLADVAEFGLRWQDYEESSQREAVRDGRSGEAVCDRAGAHHFLRRLGYRATVTVSTA